MAQLRIRCDLIFDDGDQAAADTYDALVALEPRLRTIVGSGLLVERSRVELHRCHHDEEAETPCEAISSWETG